MNIEYVPKACQGEGALFKGSVVLKVPSLEDRLGYLASIEELDELGGENKRSSMLKAQIKLLKFSYEHYVKIDLTRLSDTKHFSNLDDLRLDRDCQAILQDVSGKITEGFVLGKELGQSSKSK